MEVIDIIVAASLVILGITMGAMLVAKKRIDRNEPVWGWKRRQYFAELDASMGSASQTPLEKRTNKAKLKESRKMESIIELMELKSLSRSVIERERNEYLQILSTDFVNFNLLQVNERTAILEGYQQLFSVINFHVQLLSQAVRQDFSKDRFRFEKNLQRCNEHAAAYNRDVLNHIQNRTEVDFRITSRIFYVVKFVYEPSKLAKLTREQRERHIVDQLGLRAEIVRRALRRAKVDAEVLSTIEAAEVLKRALNRDRMVINPMITVEQNEKLSPFVTMDFSSIPAFDELVVNREEALNLVGQA